MKTQEQPKKAPTVNGLPKGIWTLEEVLSVEELLLTRDLDCGRIFEEDTDSFLSYCQHDN